jgi:hypothetical protein
MPPFGAAAQGMFGFGGRQSPTGNRFPQSNTGGGGFMRNMQPPQQQRQVIQQQPAGPQFGGPGPRGYGQGPGQAVYRPQGQARIPMNPPMMGQGQPIGGGFNPYNQQMKPPMGQAGVPGGGYMGGLPQGQYGEGGVAGPDFYNKLNPGMGGRSLQDMLQGQYSNQVVRPQIEPRGMGPSQQMMQEQMGQGMPGQWEQMRNSNRQWS